MELRVDITPASVNSIQMLRCIQHHTLAYTLSASVLRSLNTNTNTDLVRVYVSRRTIQMETHKTTALQ